MKALWFMPFTFAAGAEGFALFAPYLLAVLAALHLARAAGRYRRALGTFRLPSAPVLDVLPDAQPAL
jgi:hypothetical protein